MTEFLAIVSGFFKFFDEVTWLIKKLEKTPVAKRQELIAKIQAEGERQDQSGRPVWE